MHVLNIMPAPPGDGRAIAHFNLQLPGGVRLFNLRLARNRAGEVRVYAPTAMGAAVAAFTPEAAGSIIKLATDALEAAYAHHAA